MLSPNAMKRVAPIRGGAVTTTGNEQLAVRLSESVAEQTTLVVPIGNVEGLGGVHVMETGEAPPATVAAGYVTRTGKPSLDGSVKAAGQMIVGRSGEGVGVGVLVDSPHPAVHSATTPNAAPARITTTFTASSQAPRTTDRSLGEVCRISRIT